MKPAAHPIADLGFVNGSWRDVDLRKGVHGSLDWIALDSWDRVQGLLSQTGLLSQRVQDCVLLLHNNHCTLVSPHPTTRGPWFYCTPRYRAFYFTSVRTWLDLSALAL